MSDFEIPENQEALDALYKMLKPDKPKKTSVRTEVSKVPRSDEQIIELLKHQRDGGKAARLLEGEISDYESHSEADFALCYKLAFYTRDEEQIERIWEESGLWRDEKPGRRPDYVEKTIERAMEAQEEFYSPGTRLSPNGRVSHSHSHIGRETGKHSEPAIKLQAKFLRGRGKPEPRKWVVKNQIWEGHSAVWYGAAGVAKSLLADYLGITVAHPSFEYWIKPFEVITSPVMILDFELDEIEQHRRLWQLSIGLGLDDIPENLSYMGATEAPPVDAFLSAAEECERLGVKLVIVDSVGFALQGDSESAKDVLGFYRECVNPLRAAGATPLLIDHQSKLIKGEKYSDKDAFGSVYKTNSARSIFQVQGGKSDRGIFSTFKHKKNQFGPKEDPFTLEVIFGQGETNVMRLEHAIPDPTQEPSAAKVVYDYYGEHEGEELTRQEVIQGTGLSQSVVYRAVDELLSYGDLLEGGKKDRAQAYTYVPDSHMFG